MNEEHPLVRAFLDGGSRPMAMAGPLAESLNSVVIALDPTAGSASVAFTPDERFLQGAGVIQGGIVTAMLDYAMAIAAFTRLPPGRSFGTVSLTSHFLKPCLPGRHLARGRLERMGSRMIFAAAELERDGAPGLVATATSVMAVTSV